jgi:hypothetical protein
MPQDKAKADNSKGISKMAAVRQALNRLGADAKPLQMKPYIQKKFGIEMDANMISSYKSSVNKQAAGQSRLSHRTGRAAAGDVTLQDIQAVKQLTERMGADTVRELADLFG